MPTIDEMKRQIDEMEKQYRQLEDQSETIQESLEQKRQEIDRLQLEAYWQLNPGLRIKEGDKVDTSEIIDEYYEWTANEVDTRQADSLRWTMKKTSHICIVSQIADDLTFEAMHRIAPIPLPSPVYPIPLHLLRKARETWLKKHPDDVNWVWLLCWNDEPYAVFSNLDIAKRFFSDVEWREVDGNLTGKRRDSRDWLTLMPFLLNVIKSGIKPT